MTASQALVGPLPTVRFQDGTKVAYTPPRDTVDGSRWRNCTEHRVACDCREAELAEIIAELRGELGYAQQVAREVLAGHPTYVYEDGPNGEREVGCMCTGCQIARKAYLLPHREGDSSARDEVDGLNGDEVAAGLRWKVCINPTDRCRTLRIRRREGEYRPYHEHLVAENGQPIKTETEVPF